MDFGEPEFYRSRKDIIEGKLDMLSKMDGLKLKTYFEDQYELHRNVHNPLVNWDNQKLTKARMASIIKCMGPKLLTMFMSRLA